MDIHLSNSETVRFECVEDLVEYVEAEPRGDPRRFDNLMLSDVERYISFAVTRLDEQGQKRRSWHNEAGVCWKDNTS